MSYLVIARKYRPQTFCSIAGQEHITIALANAIVRNRVPHALLFTGPRGVGKTTSARVFARALNCTGRLLPEDGAALSPEQARDLIEPCGTCANCIEIAKGSSIAVWEIDGASNNSVDDVRDLIDSLRTAAPHGSRYKVYIIDEVHMLTTAAFNALLKSLEEPPPNTIFIFATTEPHKIPATVISRCQRHDFRRVADAVIVKNLRDIAAQEGVSSEDAVLNFIARKSFGGMRDAQTMFDRLISFCGGEVTLDRAQAALGVVGRNVFFDLAVAVLERNCAEVLKLVDTVFQGSLELRSFLGDFVLHWRNLLLASSLREQTEQQIEQRAGQHTGQHSGQLTGHGQRGSSHASVDELTSRLFDYTDEENELLRKHAELRSSEDFSHLFHLAEKAAQDAMHSNHPRFVLEAYLLKMATSQNVRSISNALAAIDKLTAMIAKGGGGAVAMPRSSEHFSSPAPAAFRSPEREVSGNRTSLASPAHGASSGVSAIADYAESNAPNSEIENASSVVPSRAHNGAQMIAEGLRWERFVDYVKSKGLPFLYAHLRRVSVTIDASEELIVRGSKFDIDALQDADLHKAFKDTWLCFVAEVGDKRSNWKFAWQDAGVVSSAAVSQSDEGNRAGRKSEERFLPGTVASNELMAKKERISKAEETARNHPSVKTVLAEFEGSKLERINVK